MQSITLKTKLLFEDKVLFAKEVLNVHSKEDRLDIGRILAVRLVRDILKEHLNFLHIQYFTDFTLKQIVNIIFKEIANEWVDYAMKELNYTKTNALDELRIQNRIAFLKTLSKEYYQDFQLIVFEEIADTFMELLVENARVDTKSILINAVINSSLVPDRSILNINSSDQLGKCVKEVLKINRDIKIQPEKFDETLQKLKNSLMQSLQKNTKY